MHWCTDYKELGAMMKKFGMEHAPKSTVEMLTVEIVESPDDNESLAIPFYSNEGSNDEEKKHPPSETQSSGNGRMSERSPTISRRSTGSGTMVQLAAPYVSVVPC